MPGVGSGMAQWLYVAVTQGPERRFVFSEVNGFIHPGLPTSRRIRIMEVTEERKDGSGLIELEAL